MLEIERKFRVVGDYKPHINRSMHLVQGYIASGRRTVRVRIADDKAWLTIKGPSRDGGLSRFEWEKEIGLREALELMQLSEGAVIEKNDDGSKSVTLVITAEQYAELFGEAMDSLSGSLGGAVSVKDVTMEITVKGGYVVEYDIEFDMDMNVEGMTVSASMDMDIDYINPGKAVKVTPPAGYENFPAIDEH